VSVQEGGESVIIKMLHFCLGTGSGWKYSYGSRLCAVE
jgi:hypothetical protein